MEEILLKELLDSLLKNEAPTNYVLAGVAIYLLKVVKGLKRTISEIKTDVSYIKQNVHYHKHDDGVPNIVFPLSNHEKSKH